MKTYVMTIGHAILLSLALIVLSACGSDDNSPMVMDDDLIMMDDDSMMMDDDDPSPIDQIQLPTLVEIENNSSGEISEIAFEYDGENRPIRFTNTNLDSESISRTTLTYGPDGLIESILDEEIEPSPFSTEFRFAYTSGILTGIDFIVNGGTANTFVVTHDETTNTYSFNNGGEQVFDFDDQNNLVSYTASGLPFLSIVHDPTNPGIANGVTGQIALGILLGDFSPTVSFGLYYFSTFQIDEVTFFDTTIQINTTYTDGLLTGAESVNMSGLITTTATSTITYEYFDL
ncbi:MAG: hypothetical protein AAF039_14945 [Bacteroidota bacterium]